MRKLGIFLFVIGLVLFGVSWVTGMLIVGGVLIPSAISTITFVPAALFIVVGGVLRYYPNPAVKHGPLVWGTVIKVDFSHMWYTWGTRYTVQYTTLNGEQIVSEVDAVRPVKGIDVPYKIRALMKSMLVDKNANVPVRYDPKKPKQFMIDRSILLKEDLDKM
ncbi:MAG: DUF3592 domain-containing protein [Desulfuromonadales bacterium]|nr:DUF3592 domain-containing protein [Desulfuromonadales bacterium]